MSKIQEVTVYAIGDSSQLSTWSNVPFLLTKALIRNGINVNRVNLSPRRTAERIFDIIVKYIIRRFYPRTSFTYFRSIFHYYDVLIRIYFSVKRFKKSEVNFFLTFSFTASGLSDNPSILFCDRTYENYVTQFLKQVPDRLEQGSISRENKSLKKSDAIISLYPAMARHLEREYQDLRIHYLGNVINCVVDVPKADLIKEKHRSNKILFIGGVHYLAGAQCLIAAYKILKNSMPELTLDIVAMEESLFDSLPEGIICHGYLDKGIDEKREQYYNLIKGAKVLVNTTPMWSGFSSMLEAMYFYTPVITSRYDEFSATFGDDISFGAYCENTPDILATTIEKLFKDSDYIGMCNLAHNVVKEFTWDNYTNKIIRIMEDLIVSKRK